MDTKKQEQSPEISITTIEKNSIEKLYPTFSKEIHRQLLTKLEVEDIKNIQQVQEKHHVFIPPDFIIKEPLNTTYALLSLSALYPKRDLQELTEFAKQHDDFPYTKETDFSELTKKYPQYYQWPSVKKYPFLLHSTITDTILQIPSLSTKQLLQLLQSPHIENTAALLSFLHEQNPKLFPQQSTLVLTEKNLSSHAEAALSLAESGISLKELAEFINKYPNFNIESYAFACAAVGNKYPECTWKNREQYINFPFSLLFYLSQECKRSSSESIAYARKYPHALFKNTFLTKVLLKQESLSIEDAHDILSKRILLPKALQILESCIKEVNQKEKDTSSPLNALQDFTGGKLQTDLLVHYIALIHGKNPELKEHLFRILEQPKISTAHACLCTATLSSQELSLSEIKKIYTSLVEGKIIHEPHEDILFHPLILKHLETQPMSLTSLFSLSLVLKRNLENQYTTEEVETQLNTILTQREKFEKSILIDKNTSTLLLSYAKGDSGLGFLAKSGEDGFNPEPYQKLFKKIGVKKSEAFRGVEGKDAFIQSISTTKGKCSIILDTHGFSDTLELSTDPDSRNKKELTLQKKPRTLTVEELFHALKTRALLNKKEGQDTKTVLMSSACFSYDYVTNLLKKWKNDTDLRQLRISPPTCISFSNKNTSTSKLIYDVIHSFSENHPKNAPLTGENLLSQIEPLNMASSSPEVWDDLGIFMQEEGENFWNDKSLGEIAMLEKLEEILEGLG